jgi:hypothetical protein
MELTLATSALALDAQLYEMSRPLLREWNKTKRAPEFGFMLDHLAIELEK